MLHKQATSKELFEILTRLMQMPFLSSFRLVGGTALSLLKGHRISVDIDLFTDNEYGNTDFDAIEEERNKAFSIVENPEDAFPKLKALQNKRGLHLNIGNDEQNLIKTDILYWEPFLFKGIEQEGIRLASIEETGAMKLDVISRGGRKKDFWELIEFFDDYSLKHLLEVYGQKYPYYSIEDVKRDLLIFLWQKRCLILFAYKIEHGGQ